MDIPPKRTLEVDSIVLDFGPKRVLQSVYLKSETGKITGLLGRNGSGKTCLLNILFGELEATQQSIRIDGEYLTGKSRNPKFIRYLPQFEIIPKSISLKRVFSDFELDFDDFLIFFPGYIKYYKAAFEQFSKGNRRIIEIYAILASQTGFCLLDEPFSQVMPIHIKAIKELILREKQHKGIIVTDHLYKHIIDICDDLYVINNGQVYLTTDTSDLVKHEYVKSI
jgi:ABC-type lipopolysaccharide export system ATPase subunit